MRRTAQNTLLALGATLLTLALVEAGLRLFAPQDRQGRIQVQLPESGHSVNPSRGTVLHELGARRVRYRYAPPHLRGRGPQPGRYHVLVVGDSFVFGELLGEHATPVARLESLLRRDTALAPVQLLNGGAMGYGTADYVRFVEEVGDAVAPQAVLVMLNTDDVGRIVQKRLYRWAGPDSLAPVRVPVSPARRLTDAVPGYNWAIEHLHVAALVRYRLRVLLRGRRTFDADYLRHGPWRHLPEPQAAEATRQAEALFARLARWCRARRVPLFVITTGWGRPALYGDPREPTRRFLAAAPAFFARLDVPFHDTAPALSRVRLRDPGRYVIAQNGHPNEAGAALIAAHAAPVVSAWLAPQVQAWRARR